MKKISLSLLVALCGVTLSAENPPPPAPEAAKPASEAVKSAPEAAKPAPEAAKPAPAADGVEGVVSLKSGALNFRLAPTKKSPVIAQVANGSPVRVLSVRGNWVEVKAPESTPVYVSEAYVPGGVALREINLRSKRDSASALVGVLPKGAAVKLLGERSNGWVRIAPPQDLKLYAVKFYIQFDEAAVKAAQAKAEKPAAPAAKPEAKAAPAPAKVAPAAAPAAPAAKPEAKAAPAAAKPAPAAAKPAPAPAKVAPSAAPAAKPEAKAAPAPAKPAPAPAKPAPAAAKVAPAPNPANMPVPEKLMAELRELGVPENAKPARFEQVGVLTRVAGSQSRATDYALMFESENRGFVAPIADGVFRKEFVDQSVRVVGRAYRIPTWKAPIVVTEKIVRTRP